MRFPNRMMPYDRRSAPRQDSGNLVVDSDPVSSDRYAALGMGVTLDLNEHGVRMQYAKPFSMGDRWRFSIALGEEVVDVIGRVVHVNPTLNGTYEAGVEFLEISGADIKKIRDHLARKLS